MHSKEDLRFVTDQDLVSVGVALVTARKVLAGVRATGAAKPAPAPAPQAGAQAAASPSTWSAEHTMKAMAKKGVHTTSRTDGQIFCSSFLGGALLGWGCALTTVVAGGTAPLLVEAPGLLALLTGAVFPVGLSMVLLSGSELLTGNFVTMALPAWTHPSVAKRQALWGSRHLAPPTQAMHTSVEDAKHALTIATHA